MKNENKNPEKKSNKNLNPVSNRFLPLSQSVSLNLEPEPKITDFKINREIGSGSFGRVYLATHLKTKVDYAIKVIDKRNKTNIEGKPYFRREIEIMSKIRHPNCVRLFGNFEDENFCYFIMEYIPGGNLYTLMSSNRNTGLNIYLVASIVRDLASAIYYLHNMIPPIIHRDIKPENVLLTNNKKIKLTDFGWSNYIDFEGEQRSTLCGTPIYLAPEMIKNSGHDKHVDIWCLGVLLFELLTGTPPFIGQNRVLLMKNIINVNIVWPMPPRLPIDPDAKDLISKILKKEPNDRISLENMIKHNFFIKYCPKVKPVFDQRPKFHSKPFIISKDIPNDENDFDSYDNNYEKIEKKSDKKKNLDIRLLLRTSRKNNNKIREATPEPTLSKYRLESKKRINTNYNTKDKNLKQNNKIKVKLYSINPNDNKEQDTTDNNDTNKILKLEKELNKALKEKEKLEKDIEDYKLRELGYNKKIEELTFALNNSGQENLLLKLELEKYKKDLEKKKREINKLVTSRNLNLNLNNQTTYNINTASNSNMMDINTIRSNNYKKIETGINKENNTRNFISRTPEGLLRRREKRIILTNNSYMKPYMKKNAVLNNGLKKEQSNNLEKIDVDKLNKNVSFSDINKLQEKRIKYHRYNNINKENNIELNFNTELNENEKCKILLNKLQRENENLKMENNKYKNQQKNFHNKIKILDDNF